MLPLIPLWMYQPPSAYSKMTHCIRRTSSIGWRLTCLWSLTPKRHPSWRSPQKTVHGFSLMSSPTMKSLQESKPWQRMRAPWLYWWPSTYWNLVYLAKRTPDPRRILLQDLPSDLVVGVVSTLVRCYSVLSFPSTHNPLFQARWVCLFLSFSVIMISCFYFLAHSCLILWFY